jgi:DNA-binding NarL/FixJ family response regulator
VAWRNRGDHERAKRLAERGLAISREIGERQATTSALYTLATLAQTGGKDERARNLFEEGLRLSAEIGNEADVAHCLAGLASMYGTEGKIVRAARLWGAEEALLEKLEDAVYTYVPDRALHRSQVAAARSQVDEAVWIAAWNEGRVMSFQQAVEYALEQERAPDPAALGPHLGGLSAREVDVLRLVATGLSNPKVAERLFLSSRTVDWHVGSIYRKLEIHSRAEATRFAAERGLL